MGILDKFKSKEEKSPRLIKLEKIVKKGGICTIVRDIDGSLILIPTFSVVRSKLPKLKNYISFFPKWYELTIRIPVYEIEEVKHLRKELEKLPRI